MATHESVLLEKVVLGEIEGKNRAIHAYDGIVWKVRTGFLALLFGSWGILLRGIVGETGVVLGPERVALVWGLLVFSLGFAVGAWIVDRSYVIRKFRVIRALDRLIEEVRSCDGDYTKIPPELLKVAGDSGEMPYDSAGYRQAARIGLLVYLVPFLILVAGVALVVL